MRVKRYFWVKKQEQLIKDYEKGLSYVELGAKYGVSIASVRTELYMLRKKRLVGKRV